MYFHYADAMQLDWIDDILAVIETGSLTRAAEQRFLTQSAFTRKIRTIEERIGSALVDRSCKPVTILPGVRALEPELRELSGRLRRLQHDLKVSAEAGGNDVTFACQHAITTTISPWVVKQLTSSLDFSVRVRSGNLDNCLMLLLSGEADFAITYESPGDADSLMPQAFDAQAVGEDILVPVASPNLIAGFGKGEIPLIAYPSDVFLGQIVSRFVLPVLPDNILLSPKAETALTLAACEYALDGIGVAWLPLTLVRKHLEKGMLERIPELPQQELNIVLIRLSSQKSGRHDRVWDHLIGAAAPPGSGL